MKPRVHVETTIVEIDNKLNYRSAVIEDTMLKEQFIEYFHDFCRTFFCKSTLLKMPPQPGMVYNYKCGYSYEWLPSKKFGTTLIVHSDLTDESLIFHVKDIKHEEHIL